MKVGCDLRGIPQACYLSYSPIRLELGLSTPRTIPVVSQSRGTVGCTVDGITPRKVNPSSTRDLDRLGPCHVISLP